MFISNSDMEHVSLVFDDLQEQHWQVGAATPEEFKFGGAPRVSSLDFQGENLMFALHWLCLAMALLKVLFCKLRLS